METTKEEMMRLFDKFITESTNGDDTARLELLKEYFTNVEFQTKFHDYVWKINGGK